MPLGQILSGLLNGHAIKLALARLVEVQIDVVNRGENNQQIG